MFEGALMTTGCFTTPKRATLSAPTRWNDAARGSMPKMSGVPALASIFFHRCEDPTAIPDAMRDDQARMGISEVGRFAAAARSPV